MRKVILNILAAFGVVFLLLALYTKTVGTRKWNRNIGVDKVQYFSHAYLAMTDGKVKVIEISSWRNYDASDAIQFTEKVTGTTYLVHSSRVVLTSEQVNWKKKPNIYTLPD